MSEAAGSRVRTRSPSDFASPKSVATSWLAAVCGAARSIDVAARRVVGRPARRRSADRELLERQILPAFARDPAIARVLFCGCAPYTSSYAVLFAGAEYWTLDPDARNRRFGASHHLIGRLESLERHNVTDFNLIICNGVLGWGLSTPPQAEAAFQACYAALTAGGYLLLGWNDVAPRNRVRPDNVAALMRFDHSAYGRFGPRMNVAGWHRHVFDFYRKPESEYLGRQRDVA
jgi:SAM-dependent methyltransferase